MNKRRFLIFTSLKKKLTSRWFIGINIFILIALILILNIGNIIALFGGDFEQEKHLLLIDNTNNTTYLKEELQKHSTDFSTVSKYIVETTNENLDTLKERVKNNSNIFVLVVNNDEANYIAADIYSNSNLSYITRSFILTVLNNLHYDIAIKDVGLTNEAIDKVNGAVNLNSIIVEEEYIPIEEKKNANIDTEVGAIVMVVLILPFFFLIVTLVQMIGAEINEEKTSKSMEYIISNVSPKDHLIAKIVSCTGFIIAQILGVVISFGIASFIKGHTTNIVTDTSQMLSKAFKSFITPEIFAKIVQILPLLIIFFIITLVTYAILAAVLASMTTNIDDFQQLQTPLMLIVSIGFFLSMFAIIYTGSNFIKVVSYIPLISLLISPALYMLGEIGVTSLIISIIIQTIFLIIVFKRGLKVYKVGILNYSGEHLWKKILIALKS